MMRLAAASCFVWAAFDWPTWGIDRLGVALLGLAFVALALPQVVRTAAPFDPFGLLTQPPPTGETAEAELAGFVERVSAYSEDGGR